MTPETPSATVIQRESKGQKWLKPLLVGGICLVLLVVGLLWGAYRYVNTTVDELATPQTERTEAEKASDFLEIGDQKLFKVKKALNFVLPGVMDVNIAQFESTQVPQSFVIVDGLDQASVNDILAPDMREKLVTLAQSQSTQRFTVDRVEAVTTGNLPLAGNKNLAYDQVKVFLKAGDKQEPRTYEALVGQLPGKTADFPVVIISYRRNMGAGAGAKTGPKGNIGLDTLDTTLVARFTEIVTLK